MIRAIAVATDTSDIVGTVELSCERDGLELSFVRAAAFAAEYVPAVPLSGGRLVVPYSAIREASDDGETLRLVLDAPRVPYKRIVLAHFTRDRRVDHRAVHRKRLVSQLAVAAGAAAFVAASLAVAAYIGSGAGVAVGTVTTFGAIALGISLAQAIGREAMLGGANAAADRRAFFAILRQHLATEIVRDEAPAAFPEPVAPVHAVPVAPGKTPFGEVSPLLLGVGASAFVGLIAIFAGTRMMTPPAEAPTTRGPAGALEVPTTSAPIVPEPMPIEEASELCTCQLPTSFAIPARVPRVTVLPRVVRRRADPKRPSLSLEIAAVNNTSSPLRDVQGVVDFLRPGRKPGDPERVHGEKGVYYEGPLAPGAAIKWHIGGRGTGYRVTLDGSDDPIDDGELASADAFQKLLDAHTRSVRLHGAAMLTRARDERASAAIEKLREDAREDEIEVLASLARAAAPVFACDVAIGPADQGANAVSACVMNTGDDEAGPLDAMIALVRPSNDAEGAQMLSSAKIASKLRIPPRTGVRIRGAAELPADREGATPEIVLEAR